jgi:hypothetical protein
MNDWQRVRGTLERLSTFGIMNECTCDEPMINWDGDACACCQIGEALEALGRLEAAPRRQQRDGDERRKSIVAFIASYWETHQYGPSQREIAEGVDLAIGRSLTYHLGVLEREGRIVRPTGLSRSIRVVAGDESPGLG